MVRHLTKALMAAGLAAGFLPAGAAQAHHSGAMFDPSKNITVQGTVKEFAYTNPHSWLHIMTMSADGKQVEWSFEAEGPSTLLRSGIKRTSFQPGDKVTVVCHPMRDGRPAGSLLSVTMADGKVLSPHLDQQAGGQYGDKQP